MSEVMRRGTRFNKQERRYMWREDWEREDTEKNEPDEVRMGKICLEGMNGVSNLTFTVETTEDFQNKMLPTLDLQIEVKQVVYRRRMIDQISFTYFQKAMKTPLVLGAQSAMSLNQKNNILSNEIVRRLSNISEDRSTEERIQVVDQFTKELKSSGYNRPQVREILACVKTAS